MLITCNIWNFQRVLHTLAATQEVPDIPISIREEAREFRPHPEEPRFRLIAREQGSFPCVVRKEYPAFLSHLKRRRSPQERREELHRKGESNSRFVPPFQESPRCLSPFQRKLFSLHCLNFHAKDRLTPRWHVGQPCGKTSWESVLGKPRGKTTGPLIQVTVNRRFSPPSQFRFGT